VREIQDHLAELYAVEVPPDLISRVTDAVLDEVREWQNRPLDAVYPVVFFDALRVKIRDEGLVKNKAVYVALALNPDGEKRVLGVWIEQAEGAKFWLKVINELKARGVNDILIAVVDGLRGFPGAITSVFPQTIVQTCIVHLIRNSLAFVSWKAARPSCPRSRRSIAPRTPTWRSSGSRSLRRSGVNAIPRSARPGAGHGSMLSHSSPSRRASVR
jgi:putative transposase